jgi:hypothetical protein
VVGIAGRTLNGKVNPSIVGVARPPTLMEEPFPWTTYLGWIDRPRRRLIGRLRRTKDHRTALRFLMILKLQQGLSRQRVARDLQCAASTVVAAAKRFLELGEEGLLDQRAGNGQPNVDERFLAKLRGVLVNVPTELGWQRPTWTRELLCLELARRAFPK